MPEGRLLAELDLSDLPDQPTAKPELLQIDLSDLPDQPQEAPPAAPEAPQQVDLTDLGDQPAEIKSTAPQDPLLDLTDLPDQSEPTPPAEPPPQQAEPVQPLGEVPPPDWQTGVGHFGGPMDLPEPSGDFRGPFTSRQVQTGARNLVETGLSYGPPILAARTLLPEGHPVRQVAEGVIAGGGAFAEGLAEPDNLALLAGLGAAGLPSVFGRAVSAGFGAQMAQQLPELWTQFVKAPDVKSKTKIATQAAATLGFTIAAGAHAALGEKAPRMVTPKVEPPAKVPPPKPPTGQPVAEIHPRFRVVGSRGRGEATPASDYDLVTNLTPEEYKTWVDTPEGEYPRLPQSIKDAANAGHDVFIQTGDQAWKVEPHPVSHDPNHFVVERVSQIEKNLLTSGKKLPPPTGVRPGGPAVQPEAAATIQYPQEAWDSIKSTAEYVRKGNDSHLITVSPSLKNPDYSRINYWDNRGIVSHLELPTEKVQGELQKNALPRGGVIVSVEGGIGGTLPSANYAGMGFYPTSTGTKGVKAFAGPKESVDWMQSRLESGGYKVSVKPVTENVPEKAGQDFFATKAQREAASVPSATTAPTAPALGGPGTPGASEPLASYEKRAFGERFIADKRIAEEIRTATGSRYYEPVPNVTTAAEAAALVDKLGLAESAQRLTDPQSNLATHVRSVMGQLVIRRLNESYLRLKDTDPAAAQAILERTVDIADWQAELGTTLGQGLQSFKVWSRLTPEGHLLSVQRMIRKARTKVIAENGETIKNIVEAAKLTSTGKNVDRAKRADQLRKQFGARDPFGRRDPAVKKLKPREWERIVELADLGLLNDQSFIDLAGEKLGIPKLTPENTAEILRLGTAIKLAPEGIPRDKATLALTKYLANIKGFPAKDLPIGIYYGNLLSGYNTQLVNTVDTALNVISEVNGLAFANPRSAMRLWSGMVRGFTEGKNDALLALTKGRMLTDSKWMDSVKLMEAAEFGKKGGVPIRTDTAMGRAFKAAAESPFAYPLRGWKYVTRLMAASDILMYKGAYEARMALLSERLAREEGLNGAALDKRVNELLGRTQEQLSQVEAQARQEGFTGAELKARMNELRDLARDTDYRADAADFAGVATYNHEPTGMLGYIAKGMGRFAEDYPMMKIFVPFTRIVANVTNRGLNYTPAGFYRAFRSPPRSEAQASHLVRATMGTAGLGILATMQAQGALEIHGAGPSDTERRKQLADAGWKPYSLKIGDHYYTYTYTPVGLGVSILGNMSDAFRYKEMHNKDIVTRGIYTISRVPSTVFSQSFLSGLSNLFQSLVGRPGETVQSVKNVLASATGGATTPTLVRDVYRFFDPTRYQTNDIVGDMLRNTPFSAAVNQPMLNAFGEPIEFPTNRFVSRLSDDPAWHIVVENELRVPVPDKYTEMPDGKGGRRPITPAEYREYLRLSGPQVKKYILSIKPEAWQTLTPELRQSAVITNTSPIREQALLRLRERVAKGEVIK